MGRRDLAVGVGGALGTLARAAVAEVVPVGPAGWPWPTLAANLLGAGLLGVLVGWTAQRTTPDAVWLAFLGVGVLGSFTTFSTFAVEVRALGLTGTGAAYGAISVLAGVTVAWVGLAAGRRACLEAERRR